MAKPLAQSPKLQVFIVGHIDNQGGLDADFAPLVNNDAEAGRAKSQQVELVAQ